MVYDTRCGVLSLCREAVGVIYSTSQISTLKYEFHKDVNVSKAAKFIQKIYGDDTVNENFVGGRFPVVKLRISA